MAITPTFAVQPTFLGTPRHRPWSGPCVVGIPHDIGTTNRSGARFGPAAIRQASRMLVDGDHPHWRFDPSQPVADSGDLKIALGDIPETLRLIEGQAREFDHLVALGGEHGITLPLLRALRKGQSRPLGVVHFDAHVDTWPENFGQSYAHGSIVFHAINEELIDPRRTIQIGIRSPVANAVADWTRDKQVTVLTAEDVHEIGPARVAKRIEEVVGSAPAYLSFDIDALDPAFAPATGTPEIGGLASWQAQSILRRLTGVHFVGMDLVEVAPAYDVSEITALAGATIVWEYLALILRRER
jgi:agmatinase